MKDKDKKILMQYLKNFDNLDIYEKQKAFMMLKPNIDWNIQKALNKFPNLPFEKEDFMFSSWMKFLYLLKKDYIVNNLNYFVKNFCEYIRWEVIRTCCKFLSNKHKALNYSLSENVDYNDLMNMKIESKNPTEVDKINAIWLHQIINKYFEKSKIKNGKEIFMLYVDGVKVKDICKIYNIERWKYNNIIKKIKNDLQKIIRPIIEK